MLKNHILGLIFIASLLIISYPQNSFAVTTVFNTDFNAGVPPEFSGSISTESVQGYAGLGTGPDVFGGNFLRNDDSPATLTTLTLSGLPPHDSVDINFLLAIIDSWDCDAPHPASPDFFNVNVDGNPVFADPFVNSSLEGSCVSPFIPSPGVELAFKQNLGFNPGTSDHLDSAYDMGLEPVFQNIPHTSGTLTIEWFSSGAGWQGETDESWAIDNVRVTVNQNIHVVGGEFLKLDSMALLLAGVQSPFAWLMYAFSVIGIGAFLFTRNANNEEM